MREAVGEGATRVLVAEDHPTNQMVMQSLLRRLGYASTVAADGLEALEALEADPCGFAVVLMDCHMPRLDGYDATRLIRERERELGRARIPILAVTASIFPEDRAKATDAGMDGFVGKPVGLTTLRDVLASTLGGACEQVEPEPRDTAASLAARASELLAIGGPALLDDVRRLFVGEAERIGAALARSFQARDHATVRELAHTLKGTSLNVGAGRLAQLARRLEAAARAGTLADAEATLTEALGEMAGTADAMRAALADQ